MTIENKGYFAHQVNLSFVAQFKINEIYRKNAFRLLQIPTTSADRDITRRKQILEISRKTQAPVPDGPSKIFSIDPDENHLDLNNLVDSLRDPVRRFYQEIFWFWPISIEKNYTDPALQALSNGSIDLAREIWAGNHSDPREYAISLHNLAVLNHFIALNSDYLRGQQETTDWQEVYKKWSDLSVLSDFWSILQDRIREVNDPRLTHDHVLDLRQSALSIIAYTNAQEAIRLAEKGDIKEAKNQILHIQNYPIGVPASDIVNLAVSDNRDRILSIANLVKQKAKNDPAHCDDVIASLLKESTTQLQIIKLVISKESNEFKALRNEIVEIAFNATEEYMETTEDWQKAIEFVNHIEKLPTTKKIEEKAKSLIESYTEFGINQNYWHCKDYFYNAIPRDVFDKLEKAREAFNKQNFEESINLLEDLLITYNSDPVLAEKAIHPPLAFTLSRQANDLVRKGLSTLDTPRTILEKIYKNIRNKEPKCIFSLMAVENNDIQNYSRKNMLFCSSCLSPISGTFYTGKKDELKYIICERCYLDDKAQLESIKKKSFNYFFQAKELLTRANSIQPSNLVVSEGLSTVYDILEKLYNISKPKPNAKVSFQANSPPPKVPHSSSLSEENEPKRKTSGCAILGIIAAIIGLIFLFSNHQDNKATYPTRTATSRPTVIPTRTPTSRPTFVSVIPSAPICPSWNTITALDAGEFVCAEGYIYGAYWGARNEIFYMTFSDEPNTLRLEMIGGYYLENIKNQCVIIMGVVNVIEGVPIIRIEFDRDGYSTNLEKCD